MKRKLPFLVLGGLCIVWLLLLYASMVQIPSRLILDTESEIYESLSNFLAGNKSVVSYAAYDRKDSAVLQDTYMRRSTDCTEVRIWGAYDPPWPVTMLAGQWPEPSRIGMVVISDEQASELFASYDCVGETILLNGQPYQVAGVYKKGAS